ncbi:hypothetical protein LEP1GSC060_2170 [Leptospira weilii serovar Ranarum str. ICFT]|uniref:Uncharacterized protein n=1 Tax=Leptospira weilii serovar Ranarum str. ICFT TaxID=1218598 RepID=N1WH04_9LEPT|nr:hypothetical protein LEP1GSC060_2170 [Leptospira weilii serovar Ranarum str. ICFT]
MTGGISKSGATHGINVFLRGPFWDLGLDGNPSFDDSELSAPVS